MELFDLVGVGEQIMTGVICIGALIKEEQLFCLPLTFISRHLQYFPQVTPPPPPSLMKVFIHFFEGNFLCFLLTSLLHIFSVLKTLHSFFATPLLTKANSANDVIKHFLDLPRVIFEDNILSLVIWWLKRLEEKKYDKGFSLCNLGMMKNKWYDGRHLLLGNQNRENFLPRVSPNNEYICKTKDILWILRSGDICWSREFSTFYWLYIGIFGDLKFQYTRKMSKVSFEGFLNRLVT